MFLKAGFLKKITLRKKVSPAGTGMFGILMG
jgi:hypothetical protein